MEIVLAMDIEEYIKRNTDGMDQNTPTLKGPEVLIIYQNLGVPCILRGRRKVIYLIRTLSKI